MEYTKTSISGIEISKTGSVYNVDTGKLVKVTDRGYFWSGKKLINLSKLILETFKGIKQKSGRIIFIDGNNKNLDPDNLEYSSKLPQLLPPPESVIIEIIRLYLGSNTDVKVKDVFNYRFQLKTVLDQRNFFEVYKDSVNIEVFQYYFSHNIPGYRELSNYFKISVNDARQTVYFFLHQIIEDCKKDKIIKQ